MNLHGELINAFMCMQDLQPIAFECIHSTVKDVTMFPQNMSIYGRQISHAIKPKVISHTILLMVMNTPYVS